jgi:hypothetical protein
MSTFRPSTPIGIPELGHRDRLSESSPSCVAAVADMTLLHGRFSFWFASVYLNSIFLTATKRGDGE